MALTRYAFRRPPFLGQGWRWKALVPVVSGLALTGFCSNLVHAQSAQSQFLYTSQAVNPNSSLLPGYGKNSLSGTLTALANSPFPERLEGGRLAIDGQSKFLFVLNATSDSISMFQIDSASGALTEVTGSPFQIGAIPPLLQPQSATSVAADKSGKWLFVGYASGEIQGESEVAEFAIDTTSGLSPQLRFVQAIDLTAEPIQLLTDPKGLRLYIGKTSQTGGGGEVYSLDSTTGAVQFAGNADPTAGVGQSIAIDPQGRFFFGGWGQREGFIDACLISPVDGTATKCLPSLDLGPSMLPQAIFTEASGKFLYATTPAVQILSFDQTTGALTLLGPAQNLSFPVGTAMSDPLGSFVYQLSSDLGVHVYAINSQSGALSEIANSPFNGGAGGATGAFGIAVSGTAVQAASGPALSLFPALTDFGSVSVGSTSATQVVSVVNTGDQALTLNGVMITGANGGSFLEKSTCVVPGVLAPNANCSVSVSFTPAGPGPLSAALQLTDNAPGSPQSFALSGTGVAVGPSVTLSPATPSFPATVEGGTAPPQRILVTNSGAAALHVSSASLSGANASDFSVSNGCTVAVAPTANCTIAVTFAPLASGQRTATLMIVDDAPNSPQSIDFSATASFAANVSAGNGTTSASVNAGATATYNLQLVPDPSFTGMVSFACSGAPSGANCQVATVAVHGAAAIPFTVTVTTSGTALIVPPGSEQRILGRPLSFVPVFALIAAVVLVCFLRFVGRFPGSPTFLRRLQFAGIAFLFLSVFGCGGGSSSSPTLQQTAPPPPPLVTPSGTFILTLTPTATNAAQKQFALTPTQLTLKVN